MYERLLGGSSACVFLCGFRSKFIQKVRLLQSTHNNARPDKRAKIQGRNSSHPLRPKFIQEAILEENVDCRA